MATKLNRTSIRRYLQEHPNYSMLKLATMDVYTDIGQAKCVMYSKNHVFYEIWLHIKGDAIEMYWEDLLVPFKDKEVMDNERKN